MAKYKLNCYGWSLEAIGKSLTDEQVKKIEDLMKKAGYEELWEVRYDLEELLEIDAWARRQVAARLSQNAVIINEKQIT